MLEILVQVESGWLEHLPEVVVQADVLTYIESAVQHKLERLDDDAGGKTERAE